MEETLRLIIKSISYCKHWTKYWIKVQRRYLNFMPTIIKLVADMRSVEERNKKLSALRLDT